MINHVIYHMNILGIETSCDETAASIIKVNDKDKVEVLSNIVLSQIDIHKKYGGVVPEIAAREHVLNILPVVDEAFKKALMNKNNIDAIAVTVGPGLITSLITGIETAKTLSYSWDIPLVAVNHIEGHIYSSFIDHKPKFPAIIITVSGGHTILALMNDHGKFEVLGETRDDAVGEAFDKAAKMMDIGYPGGPVISAEAEKYPMSNTQHSISLPRPMIHSGDFDFSFSGLKTAIKYELEKDKDWKDKVPAYSHEFQQAAIDVLIHKTIKAAKLKNAKTVVLTGGVSANIELRKQLEIAVKEKLNTVNFITPDFKYTTDNAVMIAMAGYYKAKRKDFTSWQKLKVDCSQELS